MGKIKAISVSSRKGISKTNVGSAELLENFGIINDAHAGKWHRQVSLLQSESIDKMRVKLPKLRAGAFAENITTQDFDLLSLNIGDRIKIGDDTELEITQIGKECHSKCAIYFRVGSCVMPAEGIFAKVVKSGKINVNDRIMRL